ncbi:hypothetical protein B005_3473 [Nocardiopsis alba ATCC BAA-2165]|uniref:Uncharacterized protein n=1 Tax=Nocardiopsis alba (strain ATCC BAA-2165 / BE74) TaxID=1205910 RepID=J7L776_NOCAA|nr:hypothetical protein B005_3473 [Nocardiopsis alba ATCC BAA-2165]
MFALRLRPVRVTSGRLLFLEPEPSAGTAPCSGTSDFEVRPIR